MAKPTNPPAIIALVIVLIPKIVPPVALATPIAKGDKVVESFDDFDFCLRILDNTIAILPF
jgi:hypothetical protein